MTGLRFAQAHHPGKSLTKYAPGPLLPATRPAPDGFRLSSQGYRFCSLEARDHRQFAVADPEIAASLPQGGLPLRVLIVAT